MVRIIMLLYLKNALVFKSGSLTILSLLVSSGLTVIVVKQFEKFPGIHMSLAIGTIGAILYFLFSMADFYTGLKASAALAQRRGQKNYIKSHRLYRTFWKLVGVNLLIALFTFLHIITIILRFTWLDKTTLIIMVSVIILACLFEFHSIGENIFIREGKKLKVFNFFEDVLNAIQRRVIGTIDNTNIPNNEE